MYIITWWQKDGNIESRHIAECSDRESMLDIFNNLLEDIHPSKIKIFEAVEKTITVAVEE